MGFGRPQLLGAQVLVLDLEVAGGLVIRHLLHPQVRREVRVGDAAFPDFGGVPITAFLPLGGPAFQQLRVERCQIQLVDVCGQARPAPARRSAASPAGTRALLLNISRVRPSACAASVTCCRRTRPRC